MAVPAIVTALAAELIKRYTAGLVEERLPDDVLPTKKDIVTVIETIIKENLLTIGRETSVTDELLDRVALAVKKLETVVGTTIIPFPDGKIDSLVVAWLKGRCLASTGFNRQNLKPSPGTRQHIDGVIRYFVEGNLPEIDGSEDDTLNLIDRAFISWQKVAHIPVTEAGSKEGANLLITTRSLDGAGKVLADATLGEGGIIRSLLEMRIDLSEEWDREKFQGTVCHEIGHLLGLDHSQDPKDLMYPRYQPGVFEPQPNDIARIQRLWPPSKVPTGLDPLEEGPDFGIG